ncbi:MAG: hypothetical protein J3Q66DRAFT_332498 [Benniella sp.]|nr:MAG: hypothetical protein J3Q66DRAFT_332498 [Benniella sp.]
MALQDLHSIILSNKSTEAMSVSIEYQRLSFSADFSRGRRNGTAMVIKRLDHLNSDDLQFIMRGRLEQLTIMQTPRDEDKYRLADILRHSQNLDQLEFKYEERQDPHYPSKMKLLDLVTFLALNTFSKLKSISIIYERISLTSKVTEGKVQDIVMKTQQLSDLNSDAVVVIELGYLIRLKVDNTPLKTDEVRLAHVLKTNMANFNLQIGDKQHCPYIRTEQMSLWDIVKMATPSNLCNIKSLTIDYWGLSVITGVSQGKVQDPILTVKGLDVLVYYDALDTIQWDTFSKLLIKYTPQEGDENQLDTITMRKFSRIQVEHRGEKHLIILASPEKKLQDLVHMVTSEPPEGLASFSIRCPRLSMTADVSQGNCRNMTMTIERLDCLNSEDLTFIQQGHLSRLTIKQALQEADEDRLTVIKHGSPSLNVTCQE